VTALSLGLAACGGGGEPSTGSPDDPQPFSLDLDWYVNPDHAGILTAIDKGFFRQAGLDVKPQVPSDPSAPIKEVAAGRADLAVSYEPEVLLAADKGLDVEAVGAVVDSPLTSLISLPEGGISSAADLSGKTVGTAGIPYQSDYLETIQEAGGLSASSAKEVNVGLNLLPALIGGRVDAILGGFRNIEGVDLRLRGLDPRIVPVDQLGVPTYDELVLVARPSTTIPRRSARSSRHWRGGPTTPGPIHRRPPTPCSPPARVSTRCRRGPRSAPRCRCSHRPRESRMAIWTRTRGGPTRAGWPPTT
jgi:putative hydroxymethylpyrimidine transport system substrate-binding protein